MCMCVCMCARACLCVFEYARTCVCMCVCVCVHPVPGVITYLGCSRGVGCWAFALISAQRGALLIDWLRGSGPGFLPPHSNEQTRPPAVSKVIRPTVMALSQIKSVTNQLRPPLMAITVMSSVFQ